MPRGWRALFREFDAVICPVTPTPAFPHDHSSDQDARTLMINGALQSPILTACSGPESGTLARPAGDRAADRASRRGACRSGRKTIGPRGWVTDADLSSRPPDRARVRRLQPPAAFPAHREGEVVLRRPPLKIIRAARWVGDRGGASFRSADDEDRSGPRRGRTKSAIGRRFSGDPGSPSASTTG